MEDIKPKEKKGNEVLADVVASLYDWMIRNLPYKLMYKKVWVDSKYKIWQPRWGYSKRQIEQAKAFSEKFEKNVIWD